MKRFPADTKLTEAQKNIVLDFIRKFLPKRGNKRKHSGNELEYVANVIDRIIKQQFCFNLTRKMYYSVLKNCNMIFSQKLETGTAKKRNGFHRKKVRLFGSAMPTRIMTPPLFILT